eukprot:gb/GFBE01011737.1/.p1 GENE.gb/GFBE01011737.1/~~gb/GFBE01011737.1/.p1  ORF type:complete len:135 (+),score=18.14 gb/GFBE01011737.1/:1-405(+)
MDGGNGTQDYARLDTSTSGCHDGDGLSASGSSSRSSGLSSGSGISSSVDADAKRALEEEEARLEKEVRRRDDGTATSVGSQGHPDSCAPCVFFALAPDRCSPGIRCKFCHFSHASKARVRQKVGRRRATGTARK